MFTFKIRCHKDSLKIFDWIRGHNDDIVFVFELLDKACCCFIDGKLELDEGVKLIANIIKIRLLHV